MLSVKNKMAIDQLVERLVGIVNQIRSRGVDRLALLQDNSVWYRLFKPQWNELLDVRLAIERLNPEAVDHRVIQIEVHGPVTTAASAALFDEPKFRSEIRDEIEGLVNYHDRHEIHLQLVNLITRTSLSFGDIEIHPISNTGDTTEHDLKYSSPVRSPDPTPIYAYARVPEAPGYGSMAEVNAIKATEDVLRLIRAMGLPSLWQPRVKQFGIEGRSAGSTWVIARRRPGQWDSAVNPTLMDAYVWLPHILLNYSVEQIARLEEIYQRRTPSPIEEKVLGAHYWLGDATFPGSNEEKYTKLTLAFEAAIGGEAKKFTEIGVTEMLAERTAFLLGKDQTTRMTWHRVVKDLYAVRSRILHGDRSPVDDSTLTRWAFLVWNVVLEMLRRSTRFKTMDDLVDWVRQQRYSHPGDMVPI